MRVVFADTSYWIAVLHEADVLHESAMSALAGLGSFRIITSEMVLVELLNTLSKKGALLRLAAAAAVDGLRHNANVEVVPQTRGQFSEALKLYRQREDKGWSLTDCASIIIMRNCSIQEALTSDRHFEQAGFVTLLR